MIYKSIMLFRKTAKMGNLAECQKPYTQSVNGNFGLHKMPLLKNGFLEKIEIWHVGLPCQYIHILRHFQANLSMTP